LNDSGSNRKQCDQELSATDCSHPGYKTTVTLKNFQIAPPQTIDKQLEPKAMFVNTTWTMDINA